MQNERNTVSIRQRLTGRTDELRQDILRELRKCEDETYAQLVDRVADTGEQSLSDLLADVDLAEITRDVVELRDIELALQRLAQGSYGICLDCEEPIAAGRLESNPAAVRCLKCQQAFEASDRTHHYRSL